MKSKFAIICITAAMLCCCSSRRGQTDVSVQNDPLSVGTEEMEDAGNSSLDNDELPNLADIEKRVAEMYDDIIEHYNTDSISNWDSHELYFSDSLKWLYSQLPDDEEVVEVDPWTWTQDYDTLAYIGADVKMAAQDTVIATVHLLLWHENPNYPVVLRMVKEKHSDKTDWYVDDTSNGEHPNWPSVADEIRDYIKNDKEK